jgi:dUTP pyrophosphatase
MKHIPTIQFLRLRPQEDTDIPLPRYMTQQAAGMDICAAVKEDLLLLRNEIALIPTGFAMAIPDGFEAQIRPRSGLAVKHGIGLINSPGTIDADYRGEVKIAVINLGPDSYTIHRGDRIAQMIIQKVIQANFEIVEQLDETRRNDGGFGHTGTS